MRSPAARSSISPPGVRTTTTSVMSRSRAALLSGNACDRSSLARFDSVRLVVSIVRREHVSQQQADRRRGSDHCDDPKRDYPPGPPSACHCDPLDHLATSARCASSAGPGTLQRAVRRRDRGPEHGGHLPWRRIPTRHAGSGRRVDAAAVSLTAAKASVTASRSSQRTSGRPVSSSNSQSAQGSIQCLVAPHCVDAHVGGDPVKPGAQRAASLVAGESAPGPQHRLLEGVLGVMDGSQASGSSATEPRRAAPRPCLGTPSPRTPPLSSVVMGMRRG